MAHLCRVLERATVSATKKPPNAKKLQKPRELKQGIRKERNNDMKNKTESFLTSPSTPPSTPPLTPTSPDLSTPLPTALQQPVSPTKALTDAEKQQLGRFEVLWASTEQWMTWAQIIRIAIRKLDRDVDAIHDFITFSLKHKYITLEEDMLNGTRIMRTPEAKAMAWQVLNEYQNADLAYIHDIVATEALTATQVTIDAMDDLSNDLERWNLDADKTKQLQELLKNDNKIPTALTQQTLAAVQAKVQAPGFEDTDSGSSSLSEAKNYEAKKRLF